MRIVSISHRGLRHLIEEDDARGVRPDLAPRIRRILTSLALADDPGRVLGPPGWRIHQLTGDRSGVWWISVSGDWRITFRVEDDAIADLNLEDYH